jgi:CDP-diacylglycerol---glycerol-3-phosphate 3-phosphatidyltransferase
MRSVCLAFAVFTIYQLKPKFQGWLRPLVQRLAANGVTANQVTLFGGMVSVAFGLWLYLMPLEPHWFFLIPAWMFVRMALNAMDGMLAREHGQKSTLGVYLNELSDVVSDAALYLPFARVVPFDPFMVGVVILLASLSEMAGVLGFAVGGTRRYDGPMGKSDRAFVFALLGFVVAVWGGPDGLPLALQWVVYALPAVAFLTAICIFNRIRQGARTHEHDR